MDPLLVTMFIVVILLFIGISVGSIFLVRYIRNLPVEIGNKMKHARGVAGRIQKQYDDSARKDFNDLIEKNPVLLDMFPQTLPKAIEKDQQPFAISSILSLFGPALLNLATGQSGGALSSLDLGEILKFIGPAFSKYREKVKQNYKKPEKKEKERKDVHSMPQVVSY